MSKDLFVFLLTVIICCFYIRYCLYSSAYRLYHSSLLNFAVQTKYLHRLSHMFFIRHKDCCLYGEGIYILLVGGWQMVLVNHRDLAGGVTHNDGSPQ